MSISQSAGTRFIPLLSRIVLGAAFFFSGWYHCFSMGDFTPAEQSQIKAMQAGGSATSSTQLVRWQSRMVWSMPPSRSPRLPEVRIRPHRQRSRRVDRW